MLSCIFSDDFILDIVDNIRYQPLNEEERAAFKEFLIDYGKSQHEKKEKKEYITIRISQRSHRIAQSFGKGYSVLFSQIIETVLSDEKLIEQIRNGKINGLWKAGSDKNTSRKENQI